MTTGLSRNFNVEIDQVGKVEWSKLICFFHDASIYQSWSYGAVRWSEKKLSHLVLKKNNDVVAAVQLRILQLPFVKAGIAYITWGPLWQLKSSEKDLGNLRQILCALREEYVDKRGLFLRILPAEIDDDNDEIRSILEEEGFTKNQFVRSYRTFLMDLSYPLEEIRKCFAQKWRNRLNKAEKNNLKVIEGTDDKLFQLFLKMYNEMLDRKHFVEFVSPKEFRAIQTDLYNPQKMRIIICLFEDEPVCGVIFSMIGSKGIYLLGATTNKGLKTQGAYLLQWHAIKWLKSNHCLWYDLGGIDPEKNPGTYHFKSGLSGKSGRDIKHLGQFDTCYSLASNLLVKGGDYLRFILHKYKR